MFEFKTLETLKHRLEEESQNKKVATFIEATILLKKIVALTSADANEEIFTISNQPIVFAIVNSLQELTAFSQLHSYSKSKESINSNAPLLKRNQSLPTFEPTGLHGEIINLLSSFAVSRSIKSSLTQSRCRSHISKENNQLELKVIEGNFIKIFEKYEKLLSNFARGLKYICRRQNEEKLFFQISEEILNTLTLVFRVDDETKNTYRCYSFVLSLGYLYENRILEAFERHNEYLRRNYYQQQNFWKHPGYNFQPQGQGRIYLGNLSFILLDDSIEQFQYEATRELPLNEKLNSDNKNLLWPYSLEGNQTVFSQSITENNSTHPQQHQQQMKYLSGVVANEYVFGRSIPEISSTNQKSCRNRRVRKGKRGPRHPKPTTQGFLAQLTRVEEQTH